MILTEDSDIIAVGAENRLPMPPYSGNALFVNLDLEGPLLWKNIWVGGGYEQTWVFPSAEGEIPGRWFDPIHRRAILRRCSLMHRRRGMGCGGSEKVFNTSSWEK